MKYLRDMCDKVDGFSSKEDRAKCYLKETTDKKLKPFEELKNYFLKELSTLFTTSYPILSSAQKSV